MTAVALNTTVALANSTTVTALRATETFRPAQFEQRGVALLYGAVLLQKNQAVKDQAGTGCDCVAYGHLHGLSIHKPYQWICEVADLGG